MLHTRRSHQPSHELTPYTNALQPRLTVVRKHSTASASLGESLGSSLGASLGAGGGAASTAADGDLPSVMTCANYIKLPPYSSFEVSDSADKLPSTMCADPA